MHATPANQPQPKTSARPGPGVYITHPNNAVTLIPPPHTHQTQAQLQQQRLHKGCACMHDISDQMAKRQSTALLASVTKQQHPYIRGQPMESGVFLGDGAA
jgi:hypothetical protein